MRERIAARRCVSEADLADALTLKHQALGEFLVRYKVRGEWLLEGRGPIFQTKEVPVLHDLADK